MFEAGMYSVLINHEFALSGVAGVFPNARKAKYKTTP